MKSFRDTEVWKWIRTLIEILLIALAVYGAIYLYTSLGFSEALAETDTYPGDMVTAYVICACGDYVNIRPFPNRKGEPLGRFEAGDEVYLDGKKKNGFLHCIDTGLESCDGWIHEGYVVYDKPVRLNQKARVVSKGKLAARKNIGGKRTRWLKPLSSVKVSYWSDDWCVTDCGYVQSKYLELEGE